MKAVTSPVNALIAFLPDLDPASAYALVDLLNRPFTEIERRHVTDFGFVLKKQISQSDGDEIFTIIKRFGLQDGSAIRGAEVHSILTRLAYSANLDHCDQLAIEIDKALHTQEFDPAKIRGLFVSMRQYHVRNKTFEKIRSVLSRR